jgi:hypothetical protein
VKTVKKVWHDDVNFAVELSVGGSLGVVYAFPIAKLAEGASLSRLMNEAMNRTLADNGWLVSKAELRAACKDGVVALRGIIEPYFEARGIGGQGE